MVGDPVVLAMEDRSSPPATTSYYRPPIGVRHLESVSARNVVPPGGPPKRLAGVGVFFSLHECSSAPSRRRSERDAGIYDCNLLTAKATTSVSLHC